MKTRCSNASLLMTGKAHEVRRMLRLLLDESPNPHMPLVEQLNWRAGLHPKASLVRHATFRAYPAPSKEQIL
ncbi:hypothetical protein [Paenibacillus sp. YN15]|uniref:hypothetical protein n=1 Tax=Paenibacillus sp. YN15 TaxID=1742774 RepID=UPI000DCECD1B|nr:hypothetical protein [Paenibacillus sp. YN15]RAV00940.1 hypothetical protein DQG13_13130 [Paenibacillus sp. YN15]